jgi:hypothetical protein
MITGTKVAVVATVSAVGAAIYAARKTTFVKTVVSDIKNAWKVTRQKIDPNGSVDMAELKTMIRKEREGVDIVGEAIKEAADAVEANS